MVRGSSLLTALLAASAHAWMPEHRELAAFNRTSNYLSKRAYSLPSWKIRGVNLGSSFIIEKWMASGEWNDMGCGEYNSEWGCVKGIGQDAANKAFKKHWQTWIVQDDIKKMISYGLNTIRVRIDYQRSTHPKLILRT